MTPAQHITAYFTDAATRHPLILHNPTATIPRFFEMEFDLIIQNGSKLAMKDWTLILEDHTDRLRSNADDYVHVIHKVAFWIIKHVPQGKKADLVAAYATAETIGYDIIGKLVADSGMLENTERCSADVPDDVEPPYDFDLATVEKMQIGPEFDHAYGARFSFDWNSTKEITINRARAAWVAL